MEEFGVNFILRTRIREAQSLFFPQETFWEFSCNEEQRVSANRNGSCDPVTFTLHISSSTCRPLGLTISLQKRHVLSFFQSPVGSTMEIPLSELLEILKVQGVLTKWIPLYSKELTRMGKVLVELSLSKGNQDFLSELHIMACRKLGEAGMILSRKGSASSSFSFVSEDDDYEVSTCSLFLF